MLCRQSPIVILSETNALSQIMSRVLVFILSFCVLQSLTLPHGNIPPETDDSVTQHFIDQETGLNHRMFKRSSGPWTQQRQPKSGPVPSSPSSEQKEQEQTPGAEERLDKKITGLGYQGNGVDLNVGPSLRYAKYFYNPFAYGGPDGPQFVPIYGGLPNLEGSSWW